jgi:hypothetical protein
MDGDPGERGEVPTNRPDPRPGSDDWLASQREPGQTFAAFPAGHPPTPDKRAVNQDNCG